MMVDLGLDILIGAFLITGTVLVLIGTLGLIRLPDFYTRLHAAGVTDTMGVELMLIAMMIQSGFSLVTMKLIFIALFLFFTSPTSTHAIANAAWTAGLKSKGAPDAIRTAESAGLSEEESTKEGQS